MNLQMSVTMKNKKSMKMNLAAVRIALTTMLSVACIALADEKDGKDHDAPAKPAANAEQKDAKSADASAAKAEEVKLSDEFVQQYGIRVGVAKKRKLEGSLIVPARVEFNAEAMAVVGSAVEGRVADVRVRAGDAVKKGDVLLIVESPALGEAQSEYLQRRTAVTAAEIGIDPARSAYDRAKKLYDSSQGISLTDLQKREMDLKTAQANLLVAKSAQDAGANRLSLLGMTAEDIRKLEDTGKVAPRLAIRAPLDGTVVERDANLGELVKPEREKLLVVADMSRLWVVASVPEARLRELNPGGKVKVTVAATADREYEGKVTLVSPTVDEGTRSVAVRIEVGGDTSLKPGMFAQADLAAKAESGDEEVVAVPESAVQTVEGSTAVFVPVKGEPNTYAKRMVSVGTYAGGMASIISGLDANERIVTSGTFILKAELGKASAKDED